MVCHKDCSEMGGCLSPDSSNVHGACETWKMENNLELPLPPLVFGEIVRISQKNKAHLDWDFSICGPWGPHYAHPLVCDGN